MHGNTVCYTINYHNNRNKNKLHCRTVFKTKYIPYTKFKLLLICKFCKNIDFRFEHLISCANRRDELENYNGT